MQRWEYLLVRINLFYVGLGKRWKPQYENGVEIPDWTKGLTESDYLNKKGGEGWELISFTSVVEGTDTKYKSMVLKRPLT